MHAFRLLRSWFAVALSAAIVFPGLAAAADPAAPPVVPPREGKRETITLFNGKDLSGWTGHIGKYWSVKDGVIVGRNEEPIAVSTYLLTERKFSDFRLVFDFKLAEAEMHSGLAMWGRLAPEQKDPYTYAGHLVMFPSNYGFYDLYGRRSIHGNAEKAKPVGKQHDWNHIEILAQGNRIRFVLNGVLVSDWREPDPATIKEAPIGLQLHSNKVPQEVQWKNITIETFPEDKLTTLAQVESRGAGFYDFAGIGLAWNPLLTQMLAASNTEAGKLRVYFGTYTRPGKSEGIYRSELDLATGKLSAPVLAGAAISPSFIVLDPSYKYLYAVQEGGGPPRKKGEPPAAGTVVAFAVDPTTGDLKQLNSQSSGGSGPCHVSIDKAGRNVLVANYGGGSCGVLPVRADGSLAEMSSFQQIAPAGTPEKPVAPRGHSINLDPSNRIAVCADAGTDHVWIYRFDGTKGTLTPAEPPQVSPGPLTAPRHFAFHPNGKLAFVINERACSVTAFQFDADKGTLTPVQTISTLPPGHEVQKGYSTAEVVVHPSGKFLYGSNRGHDTIVAYKIDEATGKLTLVGHQGEGVKVPRNFNIDPTGRYALVANQAGATVHVFTIDQETGALLQNVSTIELDSPVCVKFVPLAP
jgi:6-phosphogluconolactonase